MAQVWHNLLVPNHALGQYSPITQYNKIVLSVQIFHGYALRDAEDCECIAALVIELLRKESCTIHCN
jgi:hypothetical protein